MINIKDYFPPIYNDILEIKTLVNCENKLFTDLDSEFKEALLNNYVITANSNMIREYESILKITDDNKDLNFRRQRILNRLAMNMPFTLNALKQKLNELIGKDKYNVYIDNTKYTLYVESEIINQNWFMETYITINKMKPANIVFINRPVVNKQIFINETISYSQREYNYRLGTNWNLGKKPFKSLIEKGVIKLPEAPSIQENFLDKLRNYTLSNISHIKLNNKIMINTFLKKDIIDKKILLQYTVLKSTGLTEINKVDLYDKDNKLLTSINLYVPVIEDLELKHLLNIKEGM